MDVLKFAFEILIVGALALPWLAVLIRMCVPDPTPGKPINLLQFLMSVVPEGAQNAVSAVAIVAVGYFLGSAVSRVSRNFFNDELLGPVPTEDQIRSGVYWKEYCQENVAELLDLPEIKGHPKIMQKWCPPENGSTDKTAEFDPLVQEMFRLQESELLLNGRDKVDRLKDYYDQITVLRGAALNGIILVALCVFGFCGTLRARWSKRPVLNLLTFAPAGAFVCYGTYSLFGHVLGNNIHTFYSDPPLAELVLILLGGIGVWVVYRAKVARFYLPTAVVATILTVIAFGGWWWTEVMYDLQVIHSVPELQRPRAASALIRAHNSAG
jgi:hypothetical protein